MWWSRIATAFAAAALLAGCGFHPLYGGGRSGPTATELASVRIDLIPDRSGQILRNRLLDLMNPYGQPDHPKYTLRVGLSEAVSNLAVQKTEFATRAEMQIVANYQLLDAVTRKVLFHGSSSITGGYDILSSEFSTLTSEQSVRQHVLDQLADEMQDRLSAYFRLHPEQSSPGPAP